MTELLEVKTYKQPSGIIIQFRRYEKGCERMINGEPSESRGTFEWIFERLLNDEIQPSDDESNRKLYKSRIDEWEQFEKSLGSEVL